jgi:hypothetical protein
MAKFELNIYGDNDEILKRYETDHIRYGVLMEALEVDEKTKGKTEAEQIKAANAIVKRVFYGLTDEELMNADMNDVFNTYAQVTRQTEKIGGSDGAKN